MDQANMTYQELLDLFYCAFENNDDTNKLADILVASTGLSLELIGKAQSEACMIFSKNAW